MPNHCGLPPSADPKPLSAAQSISGVTPDVLAALRASLAAQTRELDELRDTVQSLQHEREQEVRRPSDSLPPVACLD